MAYVIMYGLLFNKCFYYFNFWFKLWCFKIMTQHIRNPIISFNAEIITLGTMWKIKIYRNWQGSQPISIMVWRQGQTDSKLTLVTPWVHSQEKINSIPASKLWVWIEVDVEGRLQFLFKKFLISMFIALWSDEEHYIWKHQVRFI